MPIPGPIFLTSEKKIPRGIRKIDVVEESLEELFAVRNPTFAKKSFKESVEWGRFLDKMKGRGRWVYLPWKNTAVRILEEGLYFELRTARNKNLITKAEQQNYRDMKIGIAGLSVGSSILSSLVLTGGPKTMKVADFDTLAPTNMNRIRASIAELGLPKIEIAAREVWGTDPFARLILWENGIAEEQLEKFILGKPRLDIFIDEMDNLAVKVAARFIAKRERIPVLMATDNGDGVILDVERFDREPKRKIFHGLVGGLTIAEAREAKGREWLALVQKIIGEKNMPERHRASLRELGKTLAGVPQLGTDASLAGMAVSFAVRKIANGEPLNSGRYIFDVPKILKIPRYS